MAIAVNVAGGKKGNKLSSLFGIGVEGQWEVAQNLAVRGDVGFGIVSIMDTVDKKAKTKGTYSAAYGLGLSYDWFPSGSRPSGGWAITPLVQGRLVPGDSFTSVVGLIGVELSYWTGLPPNQLELPEAEAYQRR